jgi:hypothetical protein
MRRDFPIPASPLTVTIPPVPFMSQLAELFLSSDKRRTDAHRSFLLLLYPCDTVNLDRFGLPFYHGGFQSLEMEVSLCDPEDIPGNIGASRLCNLLQSCCQDHRVPHGLKFNTKIIAQAAYHNRTGMNADTHPDGG